MSKELYQIYTDPGMDIDIWLTVKKKRKCSLWINEDSDYQGPFTYKRLDDAAMHAFQMRWIDEIECSHCMR